MTVNKETKPYGIWKNAYYLSNAQLELVVTTDVGPRIVSLTMSGKPNLLAELVDEVELSQPDVWHLRGGHRLWHAPEVKPRTYYPDNDPVTAEVHGDFVRFVQPIEETTGIQKVLDIYLAADAASVKIVHRLINQSMWQLKLAPWAITALTKGGMGIVPLPPRASHDDNVLPASSVAIWTYVDLSDPRWYFGKRTILLKQDPNNELPQKMGFLVPDGWSAYWVNGQVFLKLADYVEGADYPDLNSNFELFTNNNILEVESLAPYTMVEPGDSVEHTEHWFLFDDIAPIETEDDVDTHILPLVRQAQSTL